MASGIFVGRTSVRPTPTAPPEVERFAKTTDDRRLARMALELRRLRAEVAAVSHVASQAASQAEALEEADQKSAEEEPASEEPVALAEEERAAEAARSEFFEGLAERLDSEPWDAAFGAQTEPVISRLLPQHLGSDVLVTDVACGSSICRAKVAHPGARLSEDRLADFMLQRESLGEMSVQFDVREEGVTTLYFIRSDD